MKNKPTKPTPKPKAPKQPPEDKAANAAAKEALAEMVIKAMQYDEMVKASVASPMEEAITRAFKAKRPSTARTRASKGAWKKVFLEALSASANVTVACMAAGVDRHTAYDHRDLDKAFGEKWDQAIAVGAELMEAELHRRGYEGTLKPVFQGGKLAGIVREYSDALAMFLLKAHKPDKYRERVSVKHENPSRQPLDPAAKAASIARLLGELESAPPGEGT